MSHRSRGPWRDRGKRKSARSIMATYAWFDRPRPLSWRRFVEKFGDAQIGYMGVTVPIRELASSCTPEKVVRTHRHLIAFKSRFDSMASPSMNERRRTSWEWTESER